MLLYKLRGEEMSFNEIDAKVRASLSEMDISDDEKRERYTEMYLETMRDKKFEYLKMNKSNKTVSIGQAITTNKENFPYIHVWILNEDGSYTNHLFSPIEMQRSNTRASNSPEICFELKDRG